MDITANIRKSVAGLDRAKYRKESGMFKAEGTKCVLDTLGHFRLRMLAATPAWLEEHRPDADRELVARASRADMERMSHMSTAPDVIAVYEIPEREFATADISADRLTLALDGIQDPGNLGTIVRCADWFGIDTILCSDNTVDIFNPKTVMATMGSIARVSLIYGNLPEMLSAINPAVPVYGTFLDGTDIYTSNLTRGGIIMMGNEGRGISAEAARHITSRLYIPSWRAEGGPESLNVAMATAITLSEFRRR